MRLPRVFSFLGVSMAALLALAPGPAHANFIEHNGYDLGGIFDGTGTGEPSVDVGFGCEYLFILEGLICAKIFHEVATHTVNVGGGTYGEVFSIPVLELVVNNTGETLTDYHVEVEGLTIGAFHAFDIHCEFLGECDGALDITEVSDDVSAWLFFDDGLQDGDFFGIFAVLDFEFHGQTEISISQTPTVPEPATLLLLGLGLAGLGFARRR